MRAFEMYVDLIYLIKELDPRLFTHSIQTLKAELYPDFELQPIEKIR